VGTVIQDIQQRNPASQPRWDRFERADLLAQYRELRTQGMSERQAAKELQVPRTTLQAWRLWHDTLDICPHVAAFFQSSPGLAFLHRLVIAFHLVCVEVGACGLRRVCLFLNLTGLNRFVAASYGAQPQVNRQIEEAMVVYRHDETARLAQDMPHKDLMVTQDETFTGGLCLITMDPESNFLIVEQLAQARDQTTWHACLAPALAQFNCRVIQSTSAEAPGLLAYVEHYLEAHHSPDLFHVQPELVKAVSGPMATKERAAQKAVSEATEQLARLQSDPQSAGDEPAKHCPEIAIKEPRVWSTPSKRSKRPAMSTSGSRRNAQRSRRVSGASATPTTLSIWSVEYAATANSSPQIFKDTSSRFVRLPSTKGSARAAWNVSTKLNASCRKCKRPSSLSRVMSGSRALSSM
jgi:hypothetical protein